MTRNGDGMKTENEDAVAHANRCATTTASRQLIEAGDLVLACFGAGWSFCVVCGCSLLYALLVWVYLRVRNSTGLVAVQGCPSLARHVKKRLILRLKRDLPASSLPT